MKITKVWFENNRMYGLTDDGRTLWQSLLYYPRLMNATDAERMDYTLNAFGIRWEALDEDMSFESFEYDDPEPAGISKVLLSHPELNMSAVARRMGIQQSLLAAYANGTKKPSKERADKIVETIQAIGNELAAVQLV
ncbi:MAG: DUF2442 domain-containing protein [Bacteroidales bacterium]|nr:DUF2442 domain-containing protein [Bacteroidales bacterium]